MNIDVHWHYIPGTYIDAVRRGKGPSHECIEKDEGGEWIRFGPMRHALLPELYKPEAQIAEMDRRKTDLAAVSPSPTLLKYHLDAKAGADLHRMVNDSIADLVAAFPDRLAGLAAVPLQDPALAIKELERAMQLKGICGVEISTHVNGRHLDDPELLPFFQAAEEMGAFVFVHPLVVLAPERLSRYYLANLIGNPTETAIAIASLIFGGVYDAYPSLTCCFAHGGGTFVSMLGRWQHGHEVRPEPSINHARPPMDYLPRIYVDTLVHDDSILRHLIETVGPSNIMIGSDMPFDMGSSDQVERIERLAGLSDVDRAQILGGTARRLLGIEP